MWKKLVAGILVLLLLSGGVVYYLLANLDSFVKSAIESYGTRATQTQVKVGGVSLSLARGTGEIVGLSVANPPGYSAAPAFALGRIALTLDAARLSGPGPLIIAQLRIENPRVRYEVEGFGPRSNLQTIQSKLETFANSAAAAQAPAPGEKPVRKEIIRDLTISGGVVTVVAPAVLKTPQQLQLPPVHLTNLGAPDGATPAQLGAQIGNILLVQAMRAGADAVVKRNLGGTAIGGLLQGLLGP